MIRALRKTHRRVWVLLAILLPVLFVLAILAIPEKATEEKLYQPPEAVIRDS